MNHLVVFMCRELVSTELCYTTNLKIAITKQQISHIPRKKKPTENLLLLSFAGIPFVVDNLI